jgi:hypothetical protein
MEDIEIYVSDGIFHIFSSIFHCVHSCSDKRNLILHSRSNKRNLILHSSHKWQEHVQEQEHVQVFC